jgi:hypothetical protein
LCLGGIEMAYGFIVVLFLCHYHAKIIASTGQVCESDIIERIKAACFFKIAYRLLGLALRCLVHSLAVEQP